MQAKDLMTAPALTISDDATVRDAARLLLERNVSCLPVIDGQGRLVGMLTHPDFGLHHRFMPLGRVTCTLSWTPGPTQIS